MHFRQVHLDFHTSGHIPAIGAGFRKEEWQRRLLDAHVDSVTLFAVCHHGWSYYPTKIGTMHPHLSFDLLGRQLEACREIGVATPIYLTAGTNNVVAEEHPEWREILGDGRYPDWSPGALEPGFRILCFNTPYLDHLCAQIREVVRLYGSMCDGIFLDIIVQNECCCTWCMRDMLDQGYDPQNAAERRKFAENVLKKYFRRTTEAARSVNPDMRIFHNSGHVSPGSPELLEYFSHLELESLPTGGWGYDHFPQSAAYARTTGKEFLGMTGKFHSSWGEFGGYKHPNALRYECMSMLALGACCSIGDQLHPDGVLDPVTYRMIGQAYEEVEKKEPWCRNAVNQADVAIIPAESLASGSSGREFPGDVGAGRILLEGHFLFDVITPKADFSRYKLLILPDAIPVTAELEQKLNDYLNGGEKILATGSSGWQDGKFLFSDGIFLRGDGDTTPNYARPADFLAPEWGNPPIVMYGACKKLEIRHSGFSAGKLYDSYFNRNYLHFSSHQHAPNQLKPNGFHFGFIAEDGNLAVFTHELFTIYRRTGAVALRQILSNIISFLLGDAITLKVSLPSTARATVTRQETPCRTIVHLLYGNLSLRGGGIPGNPWLNKPIEVIEELNPLCDIHVAVKPGHAVKKVVLEPEGVSLPFLMKDGFCKFTVPEFKCHAMIVCESC